jgi:hypothetical protein
MAMMQVAMVVGILGVPLGAPGVQVPVVQEPAAQPAPESATNPWLVPPGKHPFDNIVFGRGAQKERRMPGRPQMPDMARSGPQSSDTPPRIVCGMTVVTVNPDADPKMVLTPKPDSKVEYKTRVISPRICRE